MGCKAWPRHLVRTAVVLLSFATLTRALQAAASAARPQELREQLDPAEGDYRQSQLHNHQQQQQQRRNQHQQYAHQQHHRHTATQGRTPRHQASLGNSSSYALISGPVAGGTNGGTDYRPVNTHRVHQHWPAGVAGRGEGPAAAGEAGGHQDTPPQHRRHHHHARGPHQHQPQQPHHPHRQPPPPPPPPPQQHQPVANSWRRTLVTPGTGGEGSAHGGRPAGGSGRPVTRMLTRSGPGSFNNTSKNVCTVYMYRKTVRTSHSMQPCLDATNCGQRTYSYPVAKRETCCRGWETTTTVADGCFKPICQKACRNGGRCTAPDRCSCPAGFTGKSCELDVNECKEYKPCDQTCYNTEGSYYCTCRDGFMLQSDRQSCKKIDETNDIATEARDMENDVDYDSLDIRLKKLEQDERKSYNERQELNKKVKYTMDTLSSLKSQVARLTHRLYPSVDYGNRVH